MVSNPRGRAKLPGAVWRLSLAHLLLAFGSNLLNLVLVLHFAGAEDLSSLGLVLALRTAPTFLVSLWGGVLADRWPKNLLAGFSIFASGLTNLFLLLALYWQESSFWVYLLSLVSGFLSAFGGPALYALLPFLASEQDLFSANALVRTFRNMGTLVSPVVYGLFLFLPNRDGVAYLAVGTTLAAVPLLFSLKVPLADSQEQKTASQVESMRQGFRLLRSRKLILALIGFWALSLPFQAGLAGAIQPALIAQNLGEGTWTSMSFLTSGGYILGSLVAIRLNLQKHLAPLSVFFFLLPALQLLASASLFPHALLFLLSFLAGMGLELSGVCWGTYLQKSTPKEDLGKVSSLDYAASFGLIPLGYLLASGAASLLGTRQTLYAGSLFLLAFGLITLLVLTIMTDRGDQ